MQQLCELTFYNCANATPSAVEVECGDLLRKGTMVAVPHASSVGDPEERNAQSAFFTVQCPSSNRYLHIQFHLASYPAHIVIEPRSVSVAKDKIAFNYDVNKHDDLDPEMEDDDTNDFDGYDAIDYDDDEDSDLN
uniref:Uncharacterized protein n=1 Tax=Plectus sambesii TaxID=2011161 RepID=A0A914UUH5_9BILA